MSVSKRDVRRCPSVTSQVSIKKPNRLPERPPTSEMGTNRQPPVEAWWRTYTPDDLSAFRNDADVICAFAAYLQTDPNQWFKPDGTLALNGEYFTPGLIKTGLERHRTNIHDDVAASWFVLAFLFDRRCTLVAVLLREMLLRSAERTGKEKGADARRSERRYLKLIAAWSQHLKEGQNTNLLTEPGLKSLTASWRDLSSNDWYFEGRRSVHTRRDEDDDKAVREEERGEPTLTVLAAIGDPDSSDGKRVAKNYASLIEPLPLAGASVPANSLGVALELEFPWMKRAIDRLAGDLKLRQATGTNWIGFRPMLLVGPAGVGKTRFARKLARLADTGYQEINAAGSSDNRMLAGTARGWSGAQPSLPLLAMLRGKTANPIVVVDEIDKAGGGDRNGDMRATLLTLLEPETAKAWFDECLLASCDLSQVSWILTANDVKPLSAPLLSRLMVVNVEGPQAEHFDVLVNSILQDLCEELGVARYQLPDLEPEVFEVLRGHFSRKRSVRLLKNAITSAMAHAMVKNRTRLN